VTAYLPSEHHQRRVQSNRQHEVPNNHSTQRINCDEVIDSPFPRQSYGAHDHHCSASEAKYEGEFEALDETRDFNKKSGIFNFLGGGTPCHVDLEEMAK